MEVDGYRHVQCLNNACERPANANVPIEVVAPGVIALPTLHCRSCRQALADAPDTTSVKPEEPRDA